MSNLNSKRPRDNKKKLIKKKFIDDEAEESGEELSRDEIEGSEDAYESDFIDDSPVENSNHIYRECDLQKSSSISNNSLSLSEIKKILQIDFLDPDNFPEDNFKVLDNFYDQFCDKHNFGDISCIPDDLILFNNLSAVFCFKTSVFIFTTVLFSFNYSLWHIEYWKDLNDSEIEDEIAKVVLNCIKDKMDFSGFILNFVGYYLFKFNPSLDLEDQYVRICKGLKVFPNPQDVSFKICKDPNQTLRTYEVVNLKTYKRALIENQIFYKDKPLDYDENCAKKNKADDLIKKQEISLKMDYIDKSQSELTLIGDNFFMNSAFDNDFSVVDEKEKYFDKDHKMDCSSFGIVIYMDKNDYYDSVIANEAKHFPHTLPVLAKGILFYLSKFIAYKHVEKIIVGHEHGAKLKKCHYQAMIKFYERINCKIPPGSFKIMVNKDYNQTYLIMFQSVKKNVFALENYVKKNDPLVPANKFFEFKFTRDWELIKLYKNFSCDQLLGREMKENDNNEDNKNSKKRPNDEYWQMILTTRLDEEKLGGMILSKNDVEFTKFGISNFKRILDFNHAIVKPEQPEFKWTFPQYIIDYIENYKNDVPGYNDIPKYNFFKLTYDYFKEFCEHNDPTFFDMKQSNRKLGFFVFGPGEIGKTTLFSSWCGDYPNVVFNPFIIYCRNTISWDSFEKKLDTAQMIILDDIYLNHNQIEMIKGLASGQPTYIRSLYVDNKLFNRSCPCIMLTNIDWMFDYFKETSSLSIRFNLMNISFYIGPPNTAPTRKSVVYQDPQGEREYEYRRERKRKQNNFKRNFIKEFNKFNYY